MVLNVNYSEIQDIIKQKVNKDIKLSPIDSQTVCVSTDISLPLIGVKKVNVHLRIEDVNNDSALLSYKNGIGVDLVITAILNFIEMQSDTTLVQGLSDNRIKINLNQIPKLQNTLKKIELQTLSFSSENALLKFKMK